MKNIKYLAAFILLISSLQSCSEKDIMLYENEPRIGFVLPWFDNFAFRDSISYSFPSKNLDVDRLVFEARAIGLVSDKDREIAYKVNLEKTTAIEGKHFKVIGNVLPAGKSRTNIEIEIYRTADIKDKTVRLQLDVVENSEFKAGFQRNKSVVFVWGDMFVKPDMWESSNYKKCFGEFSQVAYEFILDKTNLTELPDPNNFAVMSYLNVVIRKELSEYKRLNGGKDLLDENSKAINFPTYGGGGVG